MDTENVQFQKNRIQNVHHSAKEKVGTLDIDLIASYPKLFRDMPILEAPDKIELAK